MTCAELPVNDLVLRHPAAALAAGLLVVTALVIPLFSLRLGEPASKALAPGSSAQAALTRLESHGIPRGIVSPIDVLTTVGRAGAVVRQVRHIPGVYAAFNTAAIPPPGGTGLVEILPVAEPGTTAGAATLNAVQHALAALPGVIGVGGQGASDADFTSAVYGSFPLMLAMIALVTLILLARAFRSLVLAAKAVIFNLASLGVAYGVMVLVWQEGHGSRALWSIPATGSITVYVPLLAFAFLFGLSMDYEVFILSRIREEYDATGSTDEAVVTGIGRTGRLVTSAALILFLAFLALSATPETAIKMLATALGAGILLDAVIIRSLLLPALIGVLGRWNWWLPAPAAHILRIAPPPQPRNRPHPATSPPPAQAPSPGRRHMLIAEAHIKTTQPSRYLIQLCRHANSINHKILRPHAGKAQVRPEIQHVEWSDTAGTLTFSWGRCTMQAGPDTLTVRAEAANEESLQRIQALITRNLERFGRRDHLNVNWERPQATTAQPGEAR